MCRQDILDQWPGVTLDDRINEHGWWIPGESDDDEPVFYARAAQALSYLSNRHIDRQDTLVVVTHGRFGSALLSTILGTGPAGYSRYPFNNCGISRVDFDLHDQVAYAPPPVIIEEKTVLHAVRLRFHNDTSHLPAARRT
jgi:broad specificity phosphatase PhoE